MIRQQQSRIGKPGAVRHFRGTAFVFLLTVAVLVSAFSGCQGQPSMYSVELVNRTGTVDPKSVIVQWGSHQLSFPRLMLGGTMGEGGLTLPVPRTATVKYNDENGKEHSAEFAINSSSKVKDFVFVLLPKNRVRFRAFTTRPSTANDMLPRYKLLTDGGPAYFVGFHSPGPKSGKSSITNVRVRFGTMVAFAYRHLARGDHQSGWQFTSGLPYPITETAVLTWTDNTGIDHTREIPLKAALSANVEGNCLAFSVKDDNSVSLSEHKWSERKQWAW